MSVQKAVEQFAAAYRSAQRAGDRVVGLPWEQSSGWRRERNAAGVNLLLAAVGAEDGHPVAEEIRSRLDGVFVLVAGGPPLYHTPAREALHWFGTPDFTAQVMRWRKMAMLAPEYARELMG